MSNGGTRQPKPHPTREVDFDRALAEAGLHTAADHKGERHADVHAGEFAFDALSGPYERGDAIIGKNPQWDPSDFTGPGTRNPAWRGYDHGLLPTNSVRANTTASPTEGIVAIAGHDGNGQILPPNLGPGVWVVCGQASGYQVSMTGGGNDPYFDLSCGSILRDNQALAFRVNPEQGTPPGDLNMAFFPVRADTEEDFKLASAQATAFAGYPILQYPPGTSPSSSSTPFSLALAGPTGALLADFAPQQVTGSVAGDSVYSVSNANNDATNNGSVFIAADSADAAGAAFDFYNGNPPGTTGNGIQLAPSGTFRLSGVVFACSGEAETSGVVSPDVASTPQVPNTPLFAVITVTNPNGQPGNPVAYIATTEAVAASYVNGGTPATGIELVAGASYSWPSNEQLWAGSPGGKMNVDYSYTLTQFLSGTVTK
jgi:hypothetical protein